MGPTLRPQANDNAETETLCAMLIFSRFSLDPAAHELRCDGVPVDVQPRVLALLLHLASHSGELVSKEALAQAVWKTLDVSDEVIARTVMKARRALDEDAHAPRHLLTEVGKGYRFLGASEAVSAEGAASPAGPSPAAEEAPGLPPRERAWRVLPFVNRSENPALDWTASGMQRLLHHAMETSSRTPVSSDSPAVAGQPADGGHPASRVARAQARRPLERVVTGDVEETDDGFQLSMAWSTGGDGPPDVARLHGPSLPELVLQVAHQLAPQAAWQLQLLHQHPQAWRQLQETISHLYRWTPKEAAVRLQRCMDRLPASPPLLLQHVQLLVDLYEYDAAEAVALQVDTLLDRDHPADLDARLQAKMLLAEAPRQRGDLTLASQRVQACQAFVADHPEHSHAPLLMARLCTAAAFLHRESGQFQAAREAFERAAWHAARGGLVHRELKTRITLCQVLHWLGEGPRAQTLLHQHMARAEELGERELASWAMTVMGAIASDLNHCEEAVGWLERGLAQALPPGADTVASQNARSALMDAYLRAGVLDRAERLMRWLKRDTDSGTIARIGRLAALANLRWRQGRLAEAAQHFEQVFADGQIEAWGTWAGQLRARHATLLALLGQSAQAEQLLARGMGTAGTASTARAQAALHLAAGRREAARAGLQQAVAEHRTGSTLTLAVMLLDLAWLCQEDGDLAQAEAWLDEFAELDGAHPLSAWVERALQDRLTERPPTDWEALRQQHPQLIRHCPWLGTPEDVQARRLGSARPLPNLLSVLAW